MYNRILKRPMFKMGGRSYSAQGTGITSGLDTPKRGLVDGPGGYAGEERLTEIAEEKINVTQPRVSDGMKVLRSFGEYANPYNDRGEALTSGQIGKLQADRITGERDADYELDQAAKLENLDAEATKINKDLDRSADQANAIALQAMINSKEIELDKQYKAVDNKYKNDLADLNAKLTDPSLLVGNETVKIVQEGIRALEQKIANEKYDIARRAPVPKTTDQLIDEFVKILLSSNKDAMPDDRYTIDTALAAAEKYYGKKRTQKATGGRVGYNMGTGMDGAQPMQASMNMAETISTPNETVTEDMSMTDTVEKVPTINMPFPEFREKLPAEISDDIAELIYYNQDAFNDFSEINDQSQVYEFNNKYQVNLVLPMNTEMV